MIFATVGTQLHFDRMIEIIDLWASNTSVPVFCQIGPSTLCLKNCEYKRHLSPEEYLQILQKCSVLVAHSGIGSILSALEYKKPIIIFPRRASLGEHRNEHQLSTAHHFQNKKGIYVGYEEADLLRLLNDYTALSADDNFFPYANESLLNCIINFIHK